MVLPLLGAALGAGASIFGSILGADASSSANNTNWLINMYNQRKEQQARDDAQKYAEKLRGEDKLGQTDAQGNKTHFVEGQGWVTDLSPRQQGLQDYFYSQELPERQSQFKRKTAQSRATDDTATSLLNEFKRVQRGNPADVEAQLYEKSTRGIGEATSSALETAMRSALRGGSSNAGQIAAAISQQGMKARGDARKDAALQSEDYVDNQYAQKRSQLSQLYQMFLQDANGDVGASMDPNTVIGQTANAIGQTAGRAGAADQMGYSAASKVGGKYDYVEPDYGAANALASSGSVLAGLGDRAGSYFDKQANNDLLRQYITNGGDLNLGQGGIFGAITDRIRPTSKVF